MILNINNAYNISDQISKLEQQLFGNDLKRIYDVDKEIKCIYCLDGDNLIGFLTFKRYERNIEIYNLGINADYRRRGIGSQMLNSLTTFDLSLEVRESNDSAISFYTQNQFYPSFIRKNYYGSENAIVLERRRAMKQNAYAKINLVLNVVDRLENGYHQIEFLMDSVDLHDVVTVERSDADEVCVIDHPQLSNLDNLAYDALKVMRDNYKFTNNYKITIEKNIPVAAGMAGGSSDAAAVMRILNILEDIDASEEELAKLGAQVGSDVSYCIYSRLAIARGTGEQIEVVDSQLPTKYVLVINPGVPLSTPTVYQNHQLAETKGSIEAVLTAQNHDQFEAALFNSLAVTAHKLCPQMASLEAEIKQLTDHRVLVSGSGPTLLVFAEDRAEIEQLYNHFEGRFNNLHIAKLN